MQEVLIWAFFILFVGVSVSAAFFIIFSKNILYCLYAFLVVLIGVAGVFVIAGADFVGVSQLMIYVGGVLILFLFGIMLGPARKDRKELLQVRTVNRYPSLLLGFVVFAALLFVVNSLGFSEPLKPALDQNTVRILGLSLLTDHILILELLGVLLLLALISSTYLAAKDD